MTDHLTTTMSDTAVIGGGESRAVTFRPVIPGNLTVRSVPARRGTGVDLSRAVRRSGRRGEWTCDIVNATEDVLIFDTQIEFPSATPLEPRTATVDIPAFDHSRRDPDRIRPSGVPDRDHGAAADSV